MSVAFAIHVLATCALAGMIWFVQTVHYPFFRFVAPEQFREFLAAQRGLTLRTLGAVMVVELVSGVWVVFGGPLSGFPVWLRWVNLLLLLGTWGVTAFVQTPAQDRLVGGFQEAAFARLLQANWWRVGLWSVRALLLAGVLVAALWA